MVVDSCRDRAGGEPIALAYLRELNVDAQNAVRLIVVTHWHSDHIEGIARIVEAAPGAVVCCSAALQTSEFLTLVAARRDSRMPAASGVEELSSVLEILERRTGDRHRRRAVGPEWAMADRLLFEGGSHESVPDFRVTALSPSSATMTIAKRDFRGLFDAARNPNQVLPARSLNELSVVLWVSIGEAHVLLGGDLESSADPARGWDAVVASRSWSRQRAKLFKVPHHGSANADSPDVWSEMLGSAPLAGLTPYALGGVMLPGPEDVARLLERTPRLYITAGPARWTPPRRPSGVERTMREAGRARRVVRGPMGHIQVRWDSREGVWNPQVRLGGAALPLS